ncbi:MAG: hypothetical protein AB1414_21275 [bacterium]
MLYYKKKRSKENNSLKKCMFSIYKLLAFLVVFKARGNMMITVRITVE